MAQEDNLLAARMAVLATRDSSSMKVLAVITAVFLPGSYIATLFSMSMFNWQGSASVVTATSDGTTAAPRPGNPVVMSYIWIYWLITIILTVLVMFSWRVWFLVQDHNFKTNLPGIVEPRVGDEKNQHRSLWRMFLGFS
jgi:hypothetical protein